MRPGQSERCTFCDRPILPDEPRVGRGESAAHAACADAALRDEHLWDRIAAAVGDGGAAPGGGDDHDRPPDAGVPGGTPGSAPRASGAGRGCSMLVAGLVVLVASTVRLTG